VVLAALMRARTRPVLEPAARARTRKKKERENYNQPKPAKTS